LLVGILLINEEENLLGEGKENFFKKKSFNKQKGEKYKRKYFQKSSPRKHRFFRKAKLPIVQQGKIIASVGHTEK